MPDISLRDNYEPPVLDRGKTLELLEHLVQSQRQNLPSSGGILGQGAATSGSAPDRPTSDQPAFDPDFRQLSRVPASRAQNTAELGSAGGQSDTRVADAANDNFARDAQCTTASYDCLSHSRDEDYAAACRKAYLLCLKAGGDAQQLGATIMFNFPDRGRVILYRDGTSRYIPSASPP